MESDVAAATAYSAFPRLAPGEPFLPLSWRIQEGLAAPVVQTVPLPGSATDWIAFGNVPPAYTPRRLADWLLTESPRPFVLRGCHPALGAELLPAGGSMLISAREALLELSRDHVGRKSLRELARRGRRHGEIVSWGRSELAAQSARLAPFMARVRRSWSAPLSYLYRTQPPESERFFVLQGSERIWGLISLIPNGPVSWHTELLVRDPEAPVGIMEALISHVFAALSAEGARYWSLGEAPFYPLEMPANFKAWSLVVVGQHLDRAYSASGLLHFKAKFEPVWRPVCVYGWPKLSWRRMGGMFWRCNGHKLMAVGLRMMARKRR